MCALPRLLDFLESSEKKLTDAALEKKVKESNERLRKAWQEGNEEAVDAIFNDRKPVVRKSSKKDKSKH